LEALVRDDVAMSSPRFRGEWRSYVLTGSLLLLFAALCAWKWENNPDADAWEHHRAVQALTIDLWDPGNPTYATREPSIRYSPYSVVLASICRMTGIDPFDVVSLAVIVNVALFLAGLRFFLRSFAVQGAATAVLVTSLCLYGAPPGWANSLALCDVPAEHLNPSALSLALTLFAWGIMRRLLRPDEPPRLGWLAMPLLVSVILLTHAMTGFAMAFGLVSIALLSPPPARWRDLARAAMVLGGGLALCMLWPWFDFLQAARMQPDLWYWFNQWFLDHSLGLWSLPAIAGTALALVAGRPGFRRKPVVKFALFNAAACYALGASSYTTHSPTLSRLPLIGLFHLHLVVGVFLHETGMTRPARWGALLQRVICGDTNARARAVTSAALVGAMIWGLIPQIKAIVLTPHLARGWIAPLVGRNDKQEHYKQTMDALLKPVATHDVVLSDLMTSWVIPSTAGRIVAALHLEFFTPDQRRRRDDVDRFFDADTTAEQRLAILEEYDVKWIVLDHDRLRPGVFDQLYEPQAAINSVNGLILMDAGKWTVAAPSPRELPTMRPVISGAPASFEPAAVKRHVASDTQLGAR
jgi:hypothetical protein